MGLNEGGGRKTYVKVSDGRISVRCDESHPKAVKCTNKDGTRTWYELRYPSITGFIRNVWRRDTDWGQDLCIDLFDGKEEFELQLPFDSKYANGFFMCMPNIPLDKQITFTPWMKEVTQDGRQVKKTNLYLSTGPTDEDKIEWYWTKDEPKGLPQMVKVMLKGKEQWDNTERMAFLYQHLQETFLKKLGEQLRKDDFRGHQAAAQVSETDLTNTEDDLAF